MALAHGRASRFEYKGCCGPTAQGDRVLPVKVLILGGAGQVGRALSRFAPTEFAVDAPTRAQLDITDFATLREYLSNSRPEIVINSAAYTTVDRAESESDLANLINGFAVTELADACAIDGTRLIHISTDYVFSGDENTARMPDA